LRRLDRWLRHEAKRPITVTGSPASSTNQRTWTTYERANAASVGDGLGFALGDGVACIDLDHCLIDGVLADWAVPIVDACRGTYIEVSPSGEGLHIFGFAEVGKGRRKPGVEVYDRDRYMTVTKRRYRRCSMMLRDISEVTASL
jgi:primase-polymerase (primpol)-like protein